MIHQNIKQWTEGEQLRQSLTLEMIASENVMSPDVAWCLSTPFANKYSEGLPGKRYYSGQEYVDYVEDAARDEAKKLFGFESVNVQPHSGSPANLAIEMALLQPGDTILSLSLDQGGHLSHGHRLNYSGKAYHIVSYTLDTRTHLIDMNRVLDLALEHKPTMIIAGFSAYPRDIDWEGFSRIAKRVGAYLLADISHTAGLIVGGVLPSPVPYADVVMSTTHKTLRGPRGAIIGCRGEFEKKMNSAVFPGVQGGPHMHSILAKLQAFYEASDPSFAHYASLIQRNAQSLSLLLNQRGFSLITGGTDTHLLLLDTMESHGIPGDKAQDILESVGISVNKNMIPNDRRSALSPSGIRIGSAALSTRGFSEDDMVFVADCLHSALQNSENNDILLSIREEVHGYSKKFPLFSSQWICQ